MSIQPTLGVFTQLLPCLYPTDEENYRRGIKLLESENGKTEGIVCLFTAAKEGHIGACVKLADCYLNGIGCAKNNTEAIKYLRIAEKANDPEGLFMLAECFFAGKGVLEDSTQGITYLERAACFGSSKAFFSLGLLYNIGKFVPKNIPIARNLIEQSAILGFGPAQFFLAISMIKGSFDGSKRDIQMWLEKASENNIVEATHQLGLSKFSQKNPDYDIQKGISLLKKAAMRGHLESLGLLALANLDGFTSPLDVRKSVQALELLSTIGCHKWDAALRHFKAI